MLSGSFVECVIYSSAFYREFKHTFAHLTTSFKLKGIIRRTLQHSACLNAFLLFLSCLPELMNLTLTDFGMVPLIFKGGL